MNNLIKNVITRGILCFAMAVWSLFFSITASFAVPGNFQPQGGPSYSDPSCALGDHAFVVCGLVSTNSSLRVNVKDGIFGV